MNPEEITYCPGTLSAGYETYSPKCLRKMFNGKRVNHVLPYESPHKSESSAELFIENRKRISISGVQEKISLIQEKNKLRLTQKGEQGTHILKPIPRDLKKVSQVPANEHLTMQIAQQVYKIPTAENALIFFKDGAPAYLSKRFDLKVDGSKWGQEDFASLAGKAQNIGGPDFKYDYSYEELGLLIQQYIPAWRIEIEKYFSQVIFNYLFSNGDAHLKNFSVIESLSGDHKLSPAYDLINTRLHVDDFDMALNGGLFSQDYETDSFKANGYYAYDDFYEFGIRIGLKESRIRKILDKFCTPQKQVASLISHSFLHKELQHAYLSGYYHKYKILGYSYKKQR